MTNEVESHSRIFSWLEMFGLFYKKTRERDKLHP